MAQFEFYTVRPEESPREMQEVTNLLAERQLELDTRVEVLVVCRAGERLIASGGLEQNLIKCVAVAQDFSGESLSLRLGTELIALAAQRGRFHLFLYSAPHNRKLFRGWGFYPLVEVPGLVVVMENSPIALQAYCESLRLQRKAGRRIGFIALNANPFTLGHQFLISRATFPGCFLKQKRVIDHGWAGIDLLLFREHIAPALGIYAPLCWHRAA